MLNSFWLVSGLNSPKGRGSGAGEEGGLEVDRGIFEQVNSGGSEENTIRGLEPKEDFRQVDVASGGAAIAAGRGYARR